MRIRVLMAAVGLFLAFGGVAAADEGEVLGREHVRKLAGCFAVTYRFVEDGVHDMFREEGMLENPITEWIALDEESAERLVLTHVSITPDERAVPHFHEIWTFMGEEEGWHREIWSRTPENERRELRSECTAPWDLNKWSCHSGPSPKPFRDDGAPFGFDRDDYDKLDRAATILATGKGWVHNQHNRKIKADGTLIAHELGWITYEKIDEARCEAARRD